MISMSERASPTGGTSGARSCTSDWASCEISKPTFSPSASNAPVTGRTMSACSAVGLMNRSRWTWKSSACSASRPRALSPWAISRFDPKLTSPRGRYGRPSSAAV